MKIPCLLKDRHGIYFPPLPRHYTLFHRIFFFTVLQCLSRVSSSSLSTYGETPSDPCTLYEWQDPSRAYWCLFERNSLLFTSSFPSHPKLVLGSQCPGLWTHLATCHSVPNIFSCHLQQLCPLQSLRLISCVCVCVCTPRKHVFRRSCSPVT